MADPTNRNDPAYANDPNYVWSGGRWQYRTKSGDEGYIDPNSGPTGTVRAAPEGDIGRWFESKLGPELVNDLKMAFDPDTKARAALAANGADLDISDFAGYDKLNEKFRRGAFRQTASNPFDRQSADQSRAGTLALLEQMRAARSGPSLAAMQGAQALSQNNQAALAAGATGNQRAALLGAGSVGGALAGDTGAARLAEMLRSSAEMGTTAGNLRGADIRTSQAQSQAGLQAQQLEDRRAQMYAALGSSLDRARAQAESDNKRLLEELRLRFAKANLDLGTSVAGAGATAASTLMGM